MKTNLILIILGFIVLLPIASAADPVESWQSMELAQAGDLTVRLRVKKQASLADEFWIAIEFENRSQEDIEIEHSSYHMGSERFDLKSGELVSSGGLASGNEHALFPQAWKTTPVAPRVVKPGVYRMVDHPSLYSSALLGLPNENGFLVKGVISFNMRVKSKLVQAKQNKFQFEWLYPTEAGFEQMRTRLTHLLANHRDYVQHAYILHALLMIPEVAKATSAPELIAAIGPRTHSFSGRDYVLRHLNEQYANDAVVIDYFRKRLVAGDKQIIDDLRRADKIWQPDFLEPLVKLYESDSSSANDVFTILRLQGSPQKTDAKLAERLSSSLPDWVGAIDPNEPPHQSMLPYALKLSGQTHDRKLIPKLRPYLDDKRSTLDPNQGVTFPLGAIPPVRVCDSALDAILQILDGSTAQAYKEAGCSVFGNSAFLLNANLPVTKRQEYRVEEITKIRDKMIKALKQRLADQ